MCLYTDRQRMGGHKRVEFLISSCYSEKLRDDLIHPLEETPEGDESCRGCLLLLADTGIQVNSGSSIQGYSKPRETTNPCLSKTRALSLSSCEVRRWLCLTWHWLYMKFPPLFKNILIATLGLMLPLLHSGNLFPISLRDQRNWSRSTL